MTPAAVVPETASSSSTTNATSTANAPFFTTPAININLRACLRGGLPAERDNSNSTPRDRERRRSGSGRSNSVLDERERSRANTNPTRRRRILWRRTNSSNSAANVNSPHTSSDGQGNMEETSGRIGTSGININILGRNRRPSARSHAQANNSGSIKPENALNHHLSAGSTPLPRGDRSRSAPPASRLAASVLARASFRSNSSALPPRPRNAALRRVREVLFERSEPRFSEDLRSTKRRIIQVSRQSNVAPAQCRLGFRSRTGWEPIRAARENQDCLVALLPWGPQAQYCLFGVLDGHGRSGHFASLFVAQRIVSYLLKALKRTNKIDVAVALHRSFLYAEQKLESDESKIDCTLSGSTSVFVLIDRSTLYCANVGDSRAVLGRNRNGDAFNGTGNDNRILGAKKKTKHGYTDNVEIQPNGTLATDTASPYNAVPLSFDHKPSRPDEKARIEAEGGRVDAWQSCDVGAERVWLKDSRTPGLAVTRSFGDYMVKNIGVNSIPEIYTLPLSSADSFIVLGSDGVYEFLSNDEVVSIVGKHRENGTPQNAAEEVVKISAERWMDDDTVIDDISCIVVFLDVKDPKSGIPMEPTMLDVTHNSLQNGNIQTPASSRMSSIRPNSNPSSALFGQFSTTSSASASRQGSNARLPVPLIRPQPRRENVSPPASTLQASPPPIISASAVNDAVRKYARKLAEDGDNIASRVSITREEVFGTKISSSVTERSIDTVSGTASPKNTAASPMTSAAGTRSRMATSAVIRPGSKRVREESDADDNDKASIGSDTEMYDENAAATAAAAVLQDAGSRMRDADNNNANDNMDTTTGPLRITQSMSTKGLDAVAGDEIGGQRDSIDNIYVSDEDDEDKYADADTLVPIDNHGKVVRRREVDVHRRRLREVSTPDAIEGDKVKERKPARKESAGPGQKRKDSAMGMTIISLAPRKNSPGTTPQKRKDSNMNPGINKSNSAASAVLKSSSIKRQQSGSANDVVRLPSQIQQEAVNGTGTGGASKEGRKWFSRNLRSRRGNNTRPQTPSTHINESGTTSSYREDIGTTATTSRFRR